MLQGTTAISVNQEGTRKNEKTEHVGLVNATPQDLWLKHCTESTECQPAIRAKLSGWNDGGPLC